MTAARNKPASPLPWEWGWNGDTCAVWGAAIVLSNGAVTAAEVRRDKNATAAYITATANAYPHLITIVRKTALGSGALADQARVLLLELGEI